MTPVVLPLAILAATGSVADAGLVAAANMIPTLAFMVFGGVVADRFNRKSLLAITSCLTALLQAGMGIVLLTGNYALWIMVVIGLFSGVVAAFNGPALRGIVPELVEKSDLQRANAALATARSAARMGGPLLAGVLVATIGGGWALLVDAMSSVVAAACFLTLPVAGMAVVSGSLLSGLKTGWNSFASTRWIWISSVSFAVINAVNVAPLQIMGAAIVTPVLGAVAWGALLTGRTAGMLVAGTALVRWRLRSPLVTGRVVGVLAALPLFGLATTDNFPALLVFAFLGGFGFSILTVTYDTTLHSEIPLSMLSRVSAWDDLIAFAAIPVSQLLIGPLSDAFGYRELAFWSATGLIGATLLPLVAPSLRAVSRRSGVISAEGP